MAGRPPFVDGPAIEKLKLHAEAEPTSLSTLRDDLPEGLIAAVSRMTAKNPADCFQTPTEVADALQAYAEDKEDFVSYARDRLANLSGTSRNRWWATALTVLIFVGILGPQNDFNPPAQDISITDFQLTQILDETSASDSPANSPYAQCAYSWFSP